jgi:hypothetical protein
LRMFIGQTSTKSRQQKIEKTDQIFKLNLTHHSWRNF